MSFLSDVTGNSPQFAPDLRELQANKAYKEQAYNEAQQNQVQRASQLTIVAGRHGESMAHLSKRLDILAQRLQPLLRPSPTVGAANQAGRAPEAPMAPLAQAFNQIVDELDRMNMVVEDLLARIEL